MAYDVDVVVVGGGPGGYVAAIRAAQLGMKTALVEREHLGGICLNWGCIPTKALLRASELFHQTRHLKDFGINVGPVQVDLKKLVARSRGVASQLSKGVEFLMKKNKVQVLMGVGSWAGPETLSVQSTDGKIQSIKAKHIVFATGARARVLEHLPNDSRLIWTYREAMIPETLPSNILVVGSGAIGVEFASFYHALGVNVTIAEMQSRILPVEDHEISDLAKTLWTKQGIEILTSTQLQKATISTSGGKEDGVDVVLQSGQQTINRRFDKILVAVGIVANTEGLGLQKSKVKLERGHVVVNEWLQTHEPGVYAIGDMVGGPWLAHKASHEGVVCIEKIAGLPHVQPLSRHCIPGCTYSNPQIASVGLTENNAKQAGYDIKVGRFPFQANGKALAMGEKDGMIKTIFDAKTGELLGAHMIGAEVTELIHGFTLAKTLEATEQDLMHCIFPHPTLSEAMHESVLDAFGHALHI